MAPFGLTSPSSKTGTQAGFSMVELLLAAFIMSVGLLGLLSLQVVSVSQGGNSRQRGTATLLAHNLLDRITAEGALSAAERTESVTGTVTTKDFIFTDPATFKAYTSVDSDKNVFYFNIAGAEVTKDDPTKIFTITWQRLEGGKAGTYNATQTFIVNVQWLTSITVNGVAKSQDTYFSVSRNVRI